MNEEIAAIGRLLMMDSIFIDRLATIIAETLEAGRAGIVGSGPAPIPDPSTVINSDLMQPREDSI